MGESERTGRADVVRGQVARERRVVVAVVNGDLGTWNTDEETSREAKRCHGKWQGVVGRR